MLFRSEEAVFSAASANPLNSNLEYHAFMASWKQVFFLPDTKNIAYFFSLNAMSSSPLAYQNRLGGFDSVRGFGLNRVISLDTARANLEYRFTLLKWKIPFFDIDRVILQSCAFLDAGYGWNVAQIDPVTGKNTQNESAILYSAGAGLRAIFVHFANAIARLDFARAIRPDEGFNISFGVGQFF